MIRLNVYCGLGNQMFAYAFARAISEEFNDKDIYINPYFSFFVNLFTDRKAIKRSNRLGCFCLNRNVKVMPAYKGIPLAIIDFIDFVLHSFFTKVTAKSFDRLSQNGNYILTDPFAMQYFKHSDISSKNKKIKGCFVSEKYFQNIKSIILKEFQLTKEPSKDNKKVIDEIKSCNAVCVHIRRGDFLISGYSSYYSVCNFEYYQNGMKYIFEHTDNPVFYIFSNTSDDIKWIKDNMYFDYPVKYVDLNNPDYEELRLMSCCKHFVISNSTFSWWASYLSTNNNKMIVVPDVWLGTKPDKRYKDGKYDDVYREDMIKIHVNLEDNK